LEEPVEQEVPDTLTQDDMKSILIIDDSSMIRNYLERIFINDYNITMAVDGNDAIEKIKQNQSKLNIILLDLVMPKADGFFVLDYIQQNNIDVPVIIISGDTSKESIEKAFNYGVVDMIKKPFDSDSIKDKIVRYSK
jgi:putative two-component system response regulator